MSRAARPVKPAVAWCVRRGQFLLINTISCTRLSSKEALVKLFSPRHVDKWDEKPLKWKWEWLLRQGYDYKVIRVVVTERGAVDSPK